MLRRHPSLLALLVSEVVSVSGSQMTELALPWFVLVTTRSPAKMSTVLAVQMIAIAAFGIPGGAMASRLGSRRTMLLADAIRGPLIALVPILHLLDLLSFPVLLVIVFVNGGFFAPYQASQVVILPELVGDDEQLLARANALLLGANRTTTLLGAPVAGVLIGLIGVDGVLWIDAATFAVAFLLVRLFVPVGRAIPESEDARGLLAGVRILFRDSLLRAWTVAISGFEMAWQVVFAAVPLLAFLRYGGNPRIAGLLFAAFGGGALAGNLLVLRLLKNIMPLRLVVLAKVPQALAFWILVFDLHAVTVGLVLLFTGFCTGLIGGPATAVQTARIPPDVRAKTMTAFLTITLLAGAIGLAAAGPLVEAIGPRVLFLVVAAVHTTGTFLFVGAAVRASAVSRAAAGVVTEGDGESVADPGPLAGSDCAAESDQPRDVAVPRSDRMDWEARLR